jgi:hypothetical protein
VRRRLLIVAGSVLGLFLLAGGGSLALIESQEVVVIHTRDEIGATHPARVWIVDYEGKSWVAPGNRSNEWFQRLLVDRQVEIVRNKLRRCQHAYAVEGDEAIPVLEVFLEKYASVIRVTGFLNRLLEPGGDPTPPVVVRLDGC